MLPSTVDKTSSFTDVRPAARARARARACGRVETSPPPMQAETAALDLIGRICALDGNPAPFPAPLRCAPCPGGGRRDAMAVIRAGRAALCVLFSGLALRMGLGWFGGTRAGGVQTTQRSSKSSSRAWPLGYRPPVVPRHSRWHWPGAGTGPALALSRAWPLGTARSYRHRRALILPGARSGARRCAAASDAASAPMGTPARRTAPRTRRVVLAHK
jgi:hypothetical protein